MFAPLVFLEKEWLCIVFTVAVELSNKESLPDRMCMDIHPSKERERERERMSA